MYQFHKGSKKGEGISLSCKTVLISMVFSDLLCVPKQKISFKLKTHLIMSHSTKLSKTLLWWARLSGCQVACGQLPSVTGLLPAVANTSATYRLWAHFYCQVTASSGEPTLSGSTLPKQQVISSWRSCNLSLHGLWLLEPRWLFIIEDALRRKALSETPKTGGIN